MRTDLDRFFEASSELKQQEIEVLVLRRIGTIDRLKTAATDKRKREEYKKNGKVYLRNVLLGFKTAVWNENGEFNHPVVNETGYKGGVDLVLPADFSNLEEVRKSLQQQGLDLVQERRNVEIISVKKIENKNSHL